MPMDAEPAIHAELARRRDRLWVVAIRAARMREVARRERETARCQVAAARWHLRRARRLLARGVPEKPSTGARSVLRLRRSARG